MHFDHKPGMELYIDFSGKPRNVTDPATGGVRAVEVFVATFDYSHYTYVEALETQPKEYILEAVNNCLEFMGVVHNKRISSIHRLFFAGICRSRSYFSLEGCTECSP